jgi:hypothetical protein
LLSTALHCAGAETHLAADQYVAAVNAYGEDAAFEAATAARAHFDGKKPPRANVTQFFQRFAANHYRPGEVASAGDDLRREFEQKQGREPLVKQERAVWWRDYRKFREERGGAPA